MRNRDFGIVRNPWNWLFLHYDWCCERATSDGFWSTPQFVFTTVFYKINPASPKLWCFTYVFRKNHLEQFSRNANRITTLEIKIAQLFVTAVTVLWLRIGQSGNAGLQSSYMNTVLDRQGFTSAHSGSFRSFYQAARPVQKWKSLSKKKTPYLHLALLLRISCVFILSSLSRGVLLRVGENLPCLMIALFARKCVRSDYKITFWNSIINITWICRSFTICPQISSYECDVLKLDSSPSGLDRHLTCHRRYVFCT